MSGRGPTIALNVFQPTGAKTMGLRAVYLGGMDCNGKGFRPGSGRLEACPWCGSGIEHGMGLAFGGFGFYSYCGSDDCRWFFKELPPVEGE